MLAWLALAVRLAAACAQASDFSATAQPAFGGLVRLGDWSAVAVEIDGADPEWSGVLKASAGNLLYENKGGLPEGKGKRFWFPVRSGYSSGDQFIELRPKGGEPAVLRYGLRPLGNEDLLVAVLSDGERPAELLTSAASPIGRGTTYVVGVRGQDLPPHPKAYGSLTALVAARWRPSQLRAEQAEALRAWVFDGGLLILSADIAAYGSARWLADMLPARATAGAGLGALAGLRAHTGVPVEGRQEPATLRLEPLPASRVVLRAGPEPMAVCGRFGSGTVCSLAFDAADPGVASYEGWRVFALELIGLFSPRQDLRDSGRQTDQLIARSLESEVGQLSSKRHLSAIFSMFASSYVIVLLPLNYLVLKKRRRTDDLWAGMLAVIVAFSLGSLALGLVTRTRAATRALTIVQASIGASRGSLVSWVTHIAGDRRLSTLALPPEAEVAEEMDSTAYRYPGDIQAMSLRRSIAVRGAAAGGPNSGARFERSRGRSLIEVPMEPGAVHSFRAEGAKDLGEGMSARWDTENGLRVLRWKNGTGRRFKALLLSEQGYAVTHARAIGVEAKAEGSLSATPPWGLGPATTALESGLGSYLDDADTKAISLYLQRKRMECPGCSFLVGVPQEEHEAYVWAVPAQYPLPLIHRRLYLETRPYQGNWDVAGRLQMLSGQLVLSVPAPGTPWGAARGGEIRLQGSSLSNVKVELLDLDGGTWVPGSTPPPQDGFDEQVALPDAAQAAVLPLGPSSALAALVSSGGTVWAVRVDGKMASKTKVDVGADPKVPPAIVMGGEGTMHLVYGRKGGLSHARGSSGRWSAAPIPDTKGAGAPFLAVQGASVHLAFSVIEKGVYHGLWQGGSWKVAPVILDSGVDGPAGVASMAGPGALVCYKLKGQLGCAQGEGSSWVRNDAVLSVGPAERLTSFQMVPTPGYFAQVLALHETPAGQLLEKVMVTGPFMGARVGRLGQTLRSAGRNSMPVREPATAVRGAWSPRNGLWVAMTTGAGPALLMQDVGRAGQQASLASDKDGPFAFGLDSADGVYWVSRSARGLALRHRTGVAAALRYRVSAEERAVRFERGRQFLCPELGMVKVRLTAAGPAVLDNVFYQEVP